MRIRITEAAKLELDVIASFIADDNPTRADGFVLELLERCATLAIHPLRYPVATVWRKRDIRRCPYGSYLIFYSIVNDVLEINHIVHSARDYLRLLFPDH